MFERPIRKFNEIRQTLEEHNNNELFWIELKTNFRNEKNMYNLLGQNISGIANSCSFHRYNYGYIICGLEDKTLQEIGVKFDPFDLKVGNQDLEVSIRSKLTGVDFELLPFKKDEKNFLLIEITKAQGRISTFEKEAYFREGKNIKKLNNCSQEIQMKMNYSVNKSEFWNRIVKENLSAEKIYLTFLIQKHTIFYKIDKFP